MFSNDPTKKRKAPGTTYSRKPVPSELHRAKRRSVTDGCPDNHTVAESRRSPSALIPSEVEGEDTPLPSPQSEPAPGVEKKKKQFSGFARTAAPVPYRRRRTTPGPAPVGPKLMQMTIDLGQNLRTACRICGMSYYSSIHDDELLHRRFHAKSVGGVDFSLSIINKKSSKVVWKSDRAYVLIVDRRSSPAEKRKAREVLEVVDSELSAAEVPEATLWSDGGSERFKVLLYILGKKCVGLCLAERIRKAYWVIEGREDPRKEDMVHKGSSISISDQSRPAILGISRIWVCASNRRQGIAGKLLDCARKNFIYGMIVGKEMVAFSQPTESGGALARGWFGVGKERCGDEEANDRHWAVYVEEP